nr:MAG TPA: hypothetical protein [Caudoviricetes sp.]
MDGVFLKHHPYFMPVYLFACLKVFIFAVNYKKQAL